MRLPYAVTWANGEECAGEECDRTYKANVVARDYRFYWSLGETN